MRVEDIHSSQNFGMAIKIFDPHSAVALKRSLESSGDMDRFVNLVRTQKNNEFNIGLRYIYEINKKKLCGCIYDGRSFYREFKESDFSAKFLSPLKFIKKMCKTADELQADKNAKIIANRTLNFKV